jgi:hypothetical protein
MRQTFVFVVLGPPLGFLVFVQGPQVRFRAVKPTWVGRGAVVGL